MFRDNRVCLTNNADVSGFEKAARIEVYDWLRGLASLAVVLGHFKPFGLNKVFFVWAIHAFVLVTVVLVSQRPFGFEKIAKRLAYVAFIYASLFLILGPLFILQGIKPAMPLSTFFLNPVTVFIENPYFGHLWYLLIYAQLLIFLFFMNQQLKKWDERWVLLGALMLSNLSFTLTFIIFKNFTTLLLISWFFTVAAGLYLLPKLTAWMERNNQHRIGRCLLSFLVLTAIWSYPELRNWLISPEARVSLLSTMVYFLCIYALMELFFILNRYPGLSFLKRFVSLVSRYTLAIYIYHQGLGRLLEPYGVSMEVLTLFAIISGLFLGHILHHAFLRIERFFSGSISLARV